MVRKADTKPVTAQMYRHFAVVTLCATVAMAMFSSGENREAVAAEVAKHQSPAPRHQAGGLERRDNTPPPRASTNDGFDGEFGQPMDNLGSSAFQGGIDLNVAARAGAGVPVGYTVFGVSADVWAAMTPEQKRALTRKVQAEQAGAAKPERKQQIDSLMAASRARSGGTGPAID